jgi:trehalose 6-phosphate phosphatase
VPPGRRRPEPPPLAPDYALFLDIDGTLLDIAATPDSVRVDGRVTGLLPRLAQCLGGALALITGRSIADVDRLFPGVRLPIAGQHGIERRDAAGTVHRLPAQPGLEPLRRELQQLAAEHDGLLLEDKGETLALHYRQAPRLAPHLHRTVRATVEGSHHADDWRLQPGKGLIEVRPVGRDKGTAIAEYMSEPPFHGRTPVFAGDDRTDEFGFAAVKRAGGWAVKVGVGRTHASYRLRDVAAVLQWLGNAVAAPATDTAER